MSAEPRTEERWSLSYQRRTERLFIVAEGYATESGSKQATTEFHELLGDKVVDVVVDLNEMTGYSTGARVAWQNCFYPVRRQIRAISIVGQRLPALIRMGATVVAAFAGVPIRFYATLDDLNHRRGVA